MEFKVYISDREKKYEFFRKLQEHFSLHYKYPYYSYSYENVNGYDYEDVQGSICYLENRKKTFLRIEEFDSYILIQVISDSKRTLSVLQKFLKKVKV